MKQLTREEAIRQGYEYFVYPDEGYQAIKALQDYLEEEIDYNSSPMLCLKTPETFKIDPEDIKNLIVEFTDEYYSELTGNDTNIVTDKLEDLDASKIAEQVNLRLKTIEYYKQSEIHLVK